MVGVVESHQFECCGDGSIGKGLHKHENLSLDPSPPNTHTTQCVAECTGNPSDAGCRNRQTLVAHWPASPSETVGDPVSKT